MNKIKSLDDLRRMRERLRADLNVRENSNRPDSLPQIRVSMGTCGIASGAKEIASEFISGLGKKNIDAVVTQTGCMGHCDAEPTVVVVMPQCEPVVYGDVTPQRVSEIIEKHIMGGHTADGVIESLPPIKNIDR